MELWLEKLKSLRMLYAEDEEGIRKPMANTLSYYLKEVLEARDGEEALDLYYEQRPDIILTDLRMPKKDGLYMVKEIRKCDKKTPIVMITAHTDKEYLLSAIELKIEKYLIKPVALDELLGALKLCVTEIESGRSLFLECKNCKFDFKNRRIVYDDGKETELTHKEADFLELLLRKKGMVVSYEEIEVNVWKEEFMSIAALRTLVKSLRKKLPNSFIKNHSQTGYSFEV
ncbi:response regulator transcription factor [Sulfurospirillum halorespirans]|uniref:Putative two-component response regulator n=1 Tax=Sulfurospirillum halorespirans DSM 13726 TaxID=1193502 RepID=A0A1D7TGZ8_9BACT|nr:response regulator transcription factor [Sulfurospirillum halorespirans]AOO64285.1 putative two-component response regulator [Sulfurospirillum halorespirans DSM 13726]